MVAIVVVLAVTASVGVFSFVSTLQESPPVASFDTELRDDRVVLVHAGGDTISGSDLEVRGAKGWTGSADELGPGDRLTINPAPEVETVFLVWDGGGSSSVLANVRVSSLDIRNLVVNPGLERGTGSDADGWDQSTTGGGAQRTDERRLEGEYSVKQVDFTTGYGSREILSTPVAVTGGGEYEFGGSYYLDGTADAASDYTYSVRIKWLDSEGDEIGQDPFFGSDFGTFDSWQEVRLTETAPSNAASAQLRVRVKRDSSVDSTDVYWDELFIEAS